MSISQAWCDFDIQTKKSVSLIDIFTGWWDNLDEIFSDWLEAQTIPSTKGEAKNVTLNKKV